MLKHLSLLSSFVYLLAASTTLYADITVMGSADVNVEPNLASFSIGIETSAQTAKEAAALNAEKSNQTMDLLKKLITEDNAISTQNYSIYPEYTYNETTRDNDFKGFKAINTIQVKTRDIKSLGTLLDKTIDSGITTVNNLSFTHDHPEEIYKKALQKAFANGAERAKVLAQASGTAINGIKDITIISAGYPQPQPRYEKAMLADVRSTPTSAPEVVTSATLQIIFKS